MANNQAPVVQKKDNYIYRINLYPGDDAIGFLLICWIELSISCANGARCQLTVEFANIDLSYLNWFTYMHQTGSRLATSIIQRPTRIASGTLHHTNRPLPCAFRSKTRSGLGWTTSNKSQYFVTPRLEPVVTKPVNPFIETASFKLFSRVFFPIGHDGIANSCRRLIQITVFCHASSPFTWNQWIRSPELHISETTLQGVCESCRRLKQSLY